MSKRPKAFLKQQAKPKQKKEQTLNTADDFQSAGVDFEEAAGKWRAGDAVKSMRFFQRAIETYDQGLKAFPSSSDLAYNKARVLLEVATHPILVEQLKVPVVQALRQALDAHRYVLKLDTDNPDALYNTAQVLTSIAEEIGGDDGMPDKEALKLVQEALDLLSRCYSIQETKLQESIEQERLANEQATGMETEAASDVASSAQEGHDHDHDHDHESNDDQWFTVVEPVTHDSLIETLLAEINALTLGCSILINMDDAPPSTLPMITERYETLDQKISSLTQGNQERLQEISYAKAEFVSAVLGVGFKEGTVDAAKYKQRRDATFNVPELVENGTSETLLANARSLLAFNSALGELDPAQGPLRWTALTDCIKHLTRASKTQGLSASDLAMTHLLRGDANLYLYALAVPPVSYELAIKTAASLAKNAEGYYRNAGKLSTDQESKAVAALRMRVSQHLHQQVVEGAQISITSVVTECPKGQEWAVYQLEDMMSEGLLPEDMAN
ncbi:hypothetical protein KJ359_007429 [Pestalotiopsis sp. 9143b]|nr:hypothetical protein KJ359_007429 [Pestalotiopsis sp. 9143b]